METTINLIFMFIINLFDIYIVYRCMTIFFGKNKTDNNITIITYICRWLIGTLLNFYFPYPIISTCFFAISTFIVISCYESKLQKKILILLTIYFITIISESILAIALNITNINPLDKAEYGNIFAHIIIKIIFWTITLIIQKFKNMQLNVKLPKIFVMAIIIVPISSIIIEFIILSQQNFDRNLTVISLFCILASTFITIYLYDSYSKIFQEQAQAELSKREKDYYKKQSDLLQNNQEDLRQFRHDIKNKIISIQEMLDKKEYDHALEYTNQITHRLDHMEYYSETGNIAIDSIINYKLSYAANKGIKVTADISIPEHLEIEDDDIIIIIGNLLDNAIEANEYVKEDKYISIAIKFITGCLIIQTKNSFDSVVNEYNGKLISRKGDDITHGIGFRSIQAAADRYNGCVNYSYDDKEFEVFVMIYSTEPVR